MTRVGSLLEEATSGALGSGRLGAGRQEQRALLEWFASNGGTTASDEVYGLGMRACVVMVTGS